MNKSDVIMASLLILVAVVIVGLPLAFALPDLIIKWHDTFVYIGKCR